MLTLTRFQSVPLPRFLLQSMPLPRIVPPLHDVREAVERDMRGLWAGMEAFRLHELPAANDETLAPEPVAVPPARSSPKVDPLSASWEQASASTAVA